MHKMLKYVTFFAMMSLLIVPLFSFFTVPVRAGPAQLKSPASIVYRSTATSVNNPKNRTWDGSAWGGENIGPTTGAAVQWVRVAYNPRSDRYYEKIAVTLSRDGWLDAYVWNGATWKVTNNIGNTSSGYRSFDIAYEQKSGRAMLAYGVNATGSTQFTADWAYRIWNGTVWSAENYVNDAGHATNVNYNWIALASKPIADSYEIAMIGLDGVNIDSNGWIWDGTAWGNYKELTALAVASTPAASTEQIAVAYEQQSGYATFIFAIGGEARSWQWSGTAWDGAFTAVDLTGTADPLWFTLKADPASDKLMLTCVDGAADLNTAEWSGAAWASLVEHDTGLDSFAQRPADFEWNATGGTGILVYATAANQLEWKTWSGAAWTAKTAVSHPSTATHQWIQLRRNPRGYTADVEILGAVLDANIDLVGLKYDAGALTLSTTFTADAGVNTYESFELEFQQYVPGNVWVNPPTTTLNTGPPPPVFEIKVNVTDADALYGWEFQLFYNTTVLTAINITNGAFLTGGTVFFSVIELNNFYNTTHGRVWATATLTGATTGVFGDGTLATIKFTVDYGRTAAPSTSSFLRLVGVQLVSYRTNKQLLAQPISTINNGTVNVNFNYEAKMMINPATIIVATNTPSSSVDVNITGNLPGGSVYMVYAWEFTLLFNKTLINITSVTEGAFLSSATPPGSTKFYKDIDNSTGSIYVNATLQGAATHKNGSGVIATINFRTLTATGTNSPLNLQTSNIFLNQTNYPPRLRYGIYHPEYDATVTVTGAVPEFPFGVIMELAIPILLAYVWWRRKKTKPKINTILTSKL